MSKRYDFHIPIIVKKLEKPNNIRYKRTLWIGIRKSEPSLSDFINEDSKTIIAQEIRNVGSYPVLIVWETTSGERKYISVETDSEQRSDKTN